MPYSVKTAIVWAVADIPDDNYISIQLGGTDGNDGMSVAYKGYNDTRKACGIGIMVDGLAVAINGDISANTWDANGTVTYANNIYVNIVLRNGGSASIEVSILAFT